VSFGDELTYLTTALPLAHGERLEFAVGVSLSGAGFNGWEGVLGLTPHRVLLGSSPGMFSSGLALEFPWGDLATFSSTADEATMHVLLGPKVEAIAIRPLFLTPRLEWQATVVRLGLRLWALFPPGIPAHEVDLLTIPTDTWKKGADFLAKMGQRFPLDPEAESLRRLAALPLAEGPFLEPPADHPPMPPTVFGKIASGALHLFAGQWAETLTFCDHETLRSHPTARHLARMAKIGQVVSGPPPEDLPGRLPGRSFSVAQWAALVGVPAELRCSSWAALVRTTRDPGPILLDAWESALTLEDGKLEQALSPLRRPGLLSPHELLRLELAQALLRDDPFRVASLAGAARQEAWLPLIIAAGFRIDEPDLFRQAFGTILPPSHIAPLFSRPLAFLLVRAGQPDLARAILGSHHLPPGDEIDLLWDTLLGGALHLEEGRPDLCLETLGAALAGPPLPHSTQRFPEITLHPAGLFFSGAELTLIAECHALNGDQALATVWRGAALPWAEAAACPLLVSWAAAPESPGLDRRTDAGAGFGQGKPVFRQTVPAHAPPAFFSGPQKTLLTLALVGEFNAGKSTLANALLGAPLLPTGIRPTTCRPTIIRWGPACFALDIAPNGDRTPIFPDQLAALVDERLQSPLPTPSISYSPSLPGGFIELFAPISWLESLRIIDLPGLNSLAALHQDQVEAIMDEVDLILWVSQATRIEPAGMRAARARLVRPWQRVIAILSHLDEIDPDEREEVIAAWRAGFAEEPLATIPGSLRASSEQGSGGMLGAKVEAFLRDTIAPRAHALLEQGSIRRRDIETARWRQSLRTCKQAFSALLPPSTTDSAASPSPQQADPRAAPLRCANQPFGTTIRGGKQTRPTSCGSGHPLLAGLFPEEAGMPRSWMESWGAAIFRCPVDDRLHRIMLLRRMAIGIVDAMLACLDQSNPAHISRNFVETLLPLLGK
jgi:hypothetical protein